MANPRDFADCAGSCHLSAGGDMVCIRAAAALIVSLFELSGTVQIVVFIAVSALSLMASRPLVKKLQSAPKQKTNADRIVGQTAKVIHPITPDQKGRVMVDNLDWAAAAQNRERVLKLEKKSPLSASKALLFMFKSCNKTKL